ncbi:hypothetical protein E2C01_089416 [Portunus trituberculatus]|uniref:Uncharacterized protein n=1 Tax=Portunus trituberculatus TaxID=210409 RepID=A0A5B7JIR2_PORTR|nr:hypothetical protein [Portunus trituberculatus]
MSRLSRRATQTYQAKPGSAAPMPLIYLGKMMDKNKDKVYLLQYTPYTESLRPTTPETTAARPSPVPTGDQMLAAAYPRPPSTHEPAHPTLPQLVATFSRPGVSSFPAHHLASLNATRVFAAAVPPCLAVRRLSHTIRPLPSLSPATRMTQHDYSESCVTSP